MLPLEIRTRIVRAVNDANWAWSVLRLVSRDWRSAVLAGIDLNKIADWKVFYNREAIMGHNYPASFNVVANAMRLYAKEQNDGPETNWYEYRLFYSKIYYCPITWVGPMAIRALMGPANDPRTTFTAFQWVELIDAAIQNKRYAELICLFDHVPEHVYNSPHDSVTSAGWYSIIWWYSTKRSPGVYMNILHDKEKCKKISAGVVIQIISDTTLPTCKICSDKTCTFLNIINTLGKDGNSAIYVGIIMMTWVPMRLWPSWIVSHIDEIITLNRNRHNMIHMVIDELVRLRS